MTADDDFIGSTFPTPAGGVLTVVGWDGRRQDSSKLYTVTCTVCSLDSELFGGGLFYSIKGSLTKGQVCCGCASNPRWTLAQYELRLKRSMAGSKYTFVRWVDESAKANNTNKFVYHCEAHGERVCRTANWMNGARCKDCDYDNRLNPPDTFIGSTTKTAAGGVLTVVGWDGRKDGNTKVYTVTCSICSVDSEMFGSGLFYIRKGAFLKGADCCGCSPRHRWTLDQYELRVKRSMAGGKYTFVRWGDYNSKTNQTKMIYNCPDHGERVGTAAGWLVGKRCKDCDSDIRRKSQTGFIAHAKRVHGDTYDYSQVVYRGSFDLVEITCHTHGGFTQSPASHLAGSGCASCHNDRQRKTADDFIADANRVHGNKYDYSITDYKAARHKINILCPEHGVFVQTGNNHLSGSGCPSCAEYGFDAGKPASVYVLRVEGMHGEFTGYGITGNTNKRLQQHTRKLRQSGFEIVESVIFDFDDGQTALDIENLLKAEFPMTPQEVEGFLTEATFASQFANVVNFVQQQETVLS